MKRRDFLCLAACAAAGAAAPSHAAAGEVRDEDWLDQRRNRSLPVKIRVPAAPGPWPVVIFSHGLGGSREGGALWGEAWADAGYLVLHLQHPGSDLAGVRADRRAALAPEQVVARAEDVRFALDEMQRRRSGMQAPWTQADLSRIGMSGHSFGALTTLAVAGQRFPRGNSLGDPRLKAFMAFSPGTGGRMGQKDAPQERYGTLRGPFIFITGTLDGDVVGSGETPEGRTIPYLAAPPGGKYLWVLKDADHFTFGGQDLKPLFERAMRRSDAAKQSDAAHRAQVRAVTTRFWDAMLRGDALALQGLRRPAELADGDRWEYK